MVVTLPRWPPCPYMVKTLQKSSSTEPVGLISTKLGMSHHWLLPIIVCSNDDGRVDLDLFYSKVKFGNIGLSIGKSENCWFFRTFAACDLKPIEIMKICEYWRSRSFLDPWPKVIYIWKLKLAFLRNDWAILNQILFCAWPKYQVSVSQDHLSSG